VDRSTDYARLVVPTGNQSEAIHRWFRFKEAYSAQLFSRLLKDAGWEPVTELSLYDPFAGSGTTLVSALVASVQLGVPARLVGIERNPVMQLIASAKVAGAMNGKPLAKEVEAALPTLLQTYEAKLLSGEILETPSVTLNNEKYFPKAHVRALLTMREAIRMTSSDTVRWVFETCLAASVEPAGRLRRDGRALRHTPERKPIHPRTTFEQLTGDCIADLKRWDDPLPGSSAEVNLGDARTLMAVKDTDKFDWIVFSPPYIDYTEVYKTEAWVLGCYEDVGGMRRQRLSTVRSHPSIRFPDIYSYHHEGSRKQIDKLVRPLLDVVPKDKYMAGRQQIVQGYVDDMFQVLKSCRSLVKHDGRLVFIVGNSVHGTADARFIIAADLLMAALAELTEWTVEEIRVARWTTRRGSKDRFLRESVVALRPTPVQSSPEEQPVVESGRSASNLAS